MKRLVLKARTALALGLPNICRAGAYRLGVKVGLNSVRRLTAAVPVGPFFHECEGEGAPVNARTVGNWGDHGTLFSHWPIGLGEGIPDWLANPFDGQRIAKPEREWWRIPDFDPSVGDIKLLWELSRMDWVLAFAQRARSGQTNELHRLNNWISDWCVNNPPYRGPNWKCGQEASIRVMHVAVAAIVLKQVRTPTEGLQSLLRAHLKRISPTVLYAMAQDNNHGTSEAAALFIGGSWLAAIGDQKALRWERMGRRWLENRVRRLVGNNGSFSQYSLNYHRVLLDTLCMAEAWRRELSLPKFSPLFYKKTMLAARWLNHMVDRATGDAPNVGANDGARLLQLADTAYRDFRPTVQLSFSLFGEKRAFRDDGPWNQALYWLGIPLPDAVELNPGSWIADDGGFAVLRSADSMAMLRYPRFNFRPSQADALHLDLWRNGENLLRDAGTYSYNTDASWTSYFGGTASHNTIQFDERDQMPRLSRFLFGGWLRTTALYQYGEDEDGCKFGAAYQDGYGAEHERRIALCGNSLKVVDQVRGFRSKAVLRWRLAPGNWHVDGQSVFNGLDRLTVSANTAVVRFELVEGWESRHYLQKTPVPVLEIEVHGAGIITSDYQWAV